jgi:hypothetical protein
VLTRRRLEMALGALWLLDGALQLQPGMFTSSFFSNVLGMANMGVPGPVSRLDFGIADLVLWHPVVWNALFAGLQVALGVALLGGGRAARWARPASVAWAVSVWVVGEGFGGMFMGGSSVLNGAPGAALLYAFATLVLWPRPATRKAAPAGGLLRRWSIGTWTAVWMAVALLEVAGPNHLPFVPGAEIGNGGNGEPAPLAALNHAVGRMVGFHGAAFAVVLGLAATAVALLPLWRPARRPALGAGMVLISFLGLVGGDLGGVFSGSGTDPGLAPLGVLLGLALWPARAPVGGELADATAADDRALGAGAVGGPDGRPGGAGRSGAPERARRPAGHPVPVPAR